MFSKKRERQQNAKKPGWFRPCHRSTARAAALVLSVCVAVTMTPTMPMTAMADSGAETGLCEHHEVHTDLCGYEPGEPGQPCKHMANGGGDDEKDPMGGGKHILDCYTDELICGYIEDEDATASDSDAGHRHVQDCFALDCPHENGKHDGDCGYIEAVEGTPCGNVCELCGGTVDSGSSDNGIKSITLVAFDGLEEAVERQSVPMGTPLEELVLPETLSATAQTEDESPETVTVPGVTWEPDVLYEGAEGSYDFTASAAGYACAQGVDWPVITVTVEETVPDEIDTLCAAIDALPTVDEISDNAPGNVAPEYDAWVTETRAMLESVPALWKQFLALSEDAAAMVRITDERASKLMGLNDLAVRLGEAKTLVEPTPTVDGDKIYANGVPLLLVASDIPEYTVIYIDNGTIGELDDEDVIFDPDGTGPMNDTEFGNSISYHWIYGGGQDADITTRTRITMLGGKVGFLYGGGFNKATGSTTIIVSGGKVLGDIYGGGFGNGGIINGTTDIAFSGDAQTKNIYGGGSYGSVTGTVSINISGGTVGKSVFGGSFGNGTTGTIDLTVGGAAKIGDGSGNGVIIKDTSTYENGVDSFAIAPALTGENGSVSVYLPGDYAPGTIATGAEAGDLEKIKLVGDGAEGLETYLEEGAIKVKTSGTTTGATGGTIESGTDVETIKGYFGGESAVTVTVTAGKGTIQLQQDVTLNAKVIFNDATRDWTLDLNGHTLAGAQPTGNPADFAAANGVTPVTLTGGKLAVTSTVAGGTLRGGDAHATYTHNGYGASGASALFLEGGTLTLTDSRVTLQGGDGKAGTAATGGNGLNAWFGTVTLTGVRCQGGASPGRDRSVISGIGVYLGWGVTVSDPIYCTAESGTTGGTTTAGLFCEPAATISGGSYTGADYGACLKPDEGKQITVTGGTFTGETGLYADAATGVKLQGGSFVANDVAEGKAVAMKDSTPVKTLLSEGYGFYIDDALQTVGEAATSVGGQNETVTVKQIPVPHTHAMSVDCSTSVEDQVNFDKTLTAGATTINASGNYYLAEDVDLENNRLTVTGTGTKVNLCLNGHTLTAGDGYSGVLQVEYGAELNLCDCQPRAVNNTQITDPTTSQPVTITGGLITGGEEPTEEYSLATIMISGEAPTNRSALRMYGGTVAGNVSNAWTVSVLNGSFELHGGRLAYNTAFSMCIESIAGGHLKISGGAIEHNRLTRQNGNGYAVSHSGDSLTLSGQPVIKDNTTLNGPAAGINLDSNESITIGEGFAPDPTIGVTTATYPTESSPVAITGENDKDYSRFFFSHSDDYVIQNGANNVVQLVKKPPLSGARAITAFTISGQAGDTVIDQTNHTITVTMPNGTDITSLTPTIEVSDKAGVSPASGTAQDFTNSVTYTVTAEDETTQEYFVTVTVQTGGVVIYNESDAAAFKAILDAHPSLKTGIDENDPASWETAGLVTWTGEDSKRITKLYLNDKSLTGTLDVTGLTGLTYLDCGNNRLKTLDATGLPVVFCKNNPITFLKRANSEHLTVESAEGGTVELTDYTYDTKSAALTAAAAEGYIFKGWTATGTTLADAGANPVTFALDSIITITPVFERKPDPAPSGTGGSSSGGGGSSPNGSSVSAPSTITSTTVGENGTSITITQTTSKDSSGKTTTVTTEVTKDAAGNETGRATTVTTDHVAASAAQGSSTVTVKPDAAAINSAAKADGATAASPMDIAVSVPKDSINSEFQKADVSAVHVEVIIPKSVEDNPAVRTAGITVEKETVDAARQTGKNVTVTVREDTGAVKAVWSLDGQAMGNAEGQSTDLKLGVHTAPVQSGDPIAASVKPSVTAAGQENGLVISLTVDGTLLTAAKLTVPATNQTAITVGSTVALYRFDPNTGTLRAVPGGIYSVDADGNVMIDVPAGTRTGVKETYVLLPVQGAVGTGNGTTHTIRKGDTLNQISQQYGCRVEDLLALNPGVDIYNLQVGSDLRIR